MVLKQQVSFVSSTIIEEFHIWENIYLFLGKLFFDEKSDKT